ncbi:hypothetical protein [Micromonospora deserti]|uniref:Uncharacterized protein n=1 Tax=Micromonospora deserti TaxID=2070366 RepID=A0A2W2CYR0_9ACTN|nr:hypothetical protein [Micromonospora deserti]PZF98524.1 hypothetical protein C1I99_13265 [Micromonospora deserti]
MTGSLPPHILASVDQHKALLAELVAGVREHADAEMCEVVDVCPGPRVVDALNELCPHTRDRLLCLALAELNALDYGAPVHLTDAALAVLDRPEGGGDDDHS